jgi:rod shape-determining protein MreD
MMQDPPLRVFRLQLTYLAIVALVVLVQTLPLQSLPYPFAPADVPLAITFAWIIRRPDVMSPILITLAFLFADAILQRPPGLWTLIVLCASIFLRMRTRGRKEVLFLYEWFIVSLVMGVSFLVHYFALMFTFLPVPDVKQYIVQVLLSILIYPICKWLFCLMLRFALTQTLHPSAPRTTR